MAMNLCFSIHIYGPGHPNGRDGAWLWEVKSAGDVVDCGHVKCKTGACDEAYESAAMALGAALKKEVLNGDSYERP